MTENSSKQAFKKYLQEKKASSEKLTKLEQNELKRLEEETVVNRLIKRERYASDPEYRQKQQAHARESMKKVRERKKVEIPQVEQPEVEEVQPVKKYSAKNLF
jgi:hypothetical protein